MSNSPVSYTISASFDIKEYVDATNDAATRTRTVTIILVVASVLVAIGWYNSLVWSWPIDRVRRAYDPDDLSVHRALNTDKHPQLRLGSPLFDAGDFIEPQGLAHKLAEKKDLLSEYLYSRLTSSTAQLLGECIKNGRPSEEFLEAIADDFNRLLQDSSLYDPKRFEHVRLDERTRQLLGQHPSGSKLIRVNRLLLEDAYPLEIMKSHDKYPTPADHLRVQLQQHGARAYIENVRLIRAPFFGVAFDVNDLGIIGGIGLIIILLLLRYSLSREIKNLKISFREAVQHNQLRPFYYALAMRQVFTVPYMKDESRNRMLAISPKIICILPAIIFTLGVAYDYYTVFSSQKQFDFHAVTLLIYIELAWLILIWFLSIRCWERLSHIDHIWEDNWKRIEGMKSSVVLLDEDLIQEFGSDDAVNNALRSLRVEAAKS